MNASGETLVRWRRIFFVRTAGRRRRFGLWHQPVADGQGFIALDLGHHRLGWWYKRQFGGKAKKAKK